MNLYITKDKYDYFSVSVELAVLFLAFFGGLREASLQSKGRGHQFRLQMDRQTDRWTEGTTGRFSLALGHRSTQTRPRLPL